jgi:hypothetical protein
MELLLDGTGLPLEEMELPSDGTKWNFHKTEWQQMSDGMKLLSDKMATNAGHNNNKH